MKRFMQPKLGHPPTKASQATTHATPTTAAAKVATTTAAKQVAANRAAKQVVATTAADEELVVPANAGRKELIPNRKFTCKPEYNDMVRREFGKKGTGRVKDHVNKAVKVPLEKRIRWMTETLRAEFLRKRRDPDFIKRSEKAKKNRYSNQAATSFHPGHRQGCVSTVEVAKRLAVEKNGVLPFAVDVYERTHGFEMPDGEKMLIGDRPKKTTAEYEEKLVVYHDKGVTKAPDEVFLEVVGGRKKGGKVYGLGSASSMFYVVGSPSQTDQSTHSTSIVSQLSSRLEECKKMVEESKIIAEDSKKLVENSLKIAQASQEEYEKEKGEWKKEKEELVASMTKRNKVVAEVFNFILKERSFDPHDPLYDGFVVFTSLPKKA